MEMVESYGFRMGMRSERLEEAVTCLKQIEQTEHLTAEAVLDHARHPDSPLHQFFEWNDDKAAEEFRLHQARQLICRVTVQYRDDDRSSATVRAFVSLKPEGQGRSYISTKRAMEEPALRQQLLEKAMREAEAWEARHRHLVELGEMFEAIARVAKQIRRSKKTQRRNGRRRKRG